MKKQKILNLLFSSAYSGAENVACTIIENMKSDFDMIYCCPKGPIEKILKDRNINYIFIDKLSYSEVKKVVKEYKPDIIHAHDYRATLIAAMFSHKCKIVSHIHVNNPLMINRTKYSILFNYIFKKVDEIIWVSDSAFDNFYYKNNVLNKSTVIYNIIDAQYINKKAEAEEFKNKHDLIFLGRLSTQKNPERLVEIVKLLKKRKEDISVAVVGDGEKRAIVENLIKENDLTENITLYGFKNNPYPILKASKMLIMTSDWEGTPMVALEAQALNKPIISTPVDGMKKVIVNDYNGFLSGDNEELVAKILHFLNAKNYEKFVKNVEEHFKKINDSKNYFERIKKIYNK